MTHTKTNVIQYNEYYPFGLQASNSWTRDNTVGNQFLYNEASELNTTTGFYDLPFRNYDATLGRFFQVDPLAHMNASTSPFVYGGNNPVAFNDPSGLLMSTGEVGRYNMPDRSTRFFLCYLPTPRWRALNQLVCGDIALEPTQTPTKGGRVYKIQSESECRSEDVRCFFITLTLTLALLFALVVFT